MSIIQDALKKSKNYPEIDAVSKKQTAKQTTAFSCDVPAAMNLSRKAILSKNTVPFPLGLKLSGTGLLLISLFLVLGVVVMSSLTINKTAPHKSHDLIKSPVDVPADKAPSEGAAGQKNISVKNEGTAFKGVVHSMTDSLIRQAYSNFVLNGVMYIEGEPRAIINNTVVKEGDNVGGATVIRIDKDRVTLKANEAEIVLRVS